MAEKDSLPNYIKLRPTEFDPNKILIYIDTLDKRSIDAEIEYERYKEVKKELSRRKKLHLYMKIEAKNAHSYCDSLKQKSINQLAIDKLTNWKPN